MFSITTVVQTIRFSKGCDKILQKVVCWIPESNWDERAYHFGIERQQNYIFKNFVKGPAFRVLRDSDFLKEKIIQLGDDTSCFELNLTSLKREMIQTTRLPFWGHSIKHLSFGNSQPLGEYWKRPGVLAELCPKCCCYYFE